MQKEMRVCSFGSAYSGFCETLGGLENEKGDYVAFKKYLDDNNYQIDEKDVLFNAFLVGSDIEKNEERKNEEK